MAQHTTTGRTINDVVQDLISEVNDGTIAVVVNEQVIQASTTKVFRIVVYEESVVIIMYW